MDTDSEWWYRVKEVIRVTISDYAAWEHREPVIDLSSYCEQIIEPATPPVTPDQTLARIKSLRSEGTLEPILTELKSANLANTAICPKVDAVIAMIAITLDIKNQEFASELSLSIEPLETAISNIENKSRSSAGIITFAENLQTGINSLRLAEQIYNQLGSVVISPESNSKETVETEVAQAVDQQDLSALSELHRCIAMCRWRPDDFDRFSYRSFEELVADLYQAKGFTTDVQAKGPDGGVDVIATTSEVQKAIQVKHVSNPVTAPQLDKYVSLFEYHDELDQVVMVSASSFTTPAEERVSQVSKPLKLIDGEGLCSLLNQADITVPIK
jgi:mannose/fructose/N-acetylgalactosamine-specific phosphotransferase system component IIB